MIRAAALVVLLSTPCAPSPGRGALVEVAPPTGDPVQDRARIVAALERAVPGDTVRFAAGTYEVGAIVRVATPRLTLLGHPDGTTLRGRDGYDPDAGELAPGDYGVDEADAFGVLHLFEGGSTVRGLTFSDSWWGLLLGWHYGFAWDEREPEEQGGFLVEGCTFARSQNGIRSTNLGPAETVVRDNVFRDVHYGVSTLGNAFVIEDNEFTMSDAPRSQGRGTAVRLGAEHVAGGCSDNRILGNAITGHERGVSLMTDGSRTGTGNEVRGNRIALADNDADACGIELRRRAEHESDELPTGGLLGTRIEDNHVSGAGRAAISIGGGCDDARVARNTFADLRGPAILIGGNRARIEGHADDVEIRYVGTGEARFPIGQVDQIGASAADFDRVAALSSEVGRWARDGEIVGAELLVVRAGAVVLHDVYGWSDREEQRPLERGSIQRIRSMTKPFVGAAALLLVDEGALDLDDRVADYLPAFAEGSSADVTVRQLLTHTSGFEGVGELLDALRAGGVEPAEFASLEEVAAASGRVGPTASPAQYTYSDVGSACLAAVVARVAGMPFERFLETRVLEPLGLSDTHTSYAPSAPWRARAASTYEWSDDEGAFERYWHPGLEQEARFFRGSGGLYSTAADVARFASDWLAWTETGGLLTRELARAALQPHAHRSPTEGYGYHWTVSTSTAGGLPRLFGHGGSDGTRVWAFPEADTIVVYFSQSRGHSMRSEFVSLLSRELPFARFLGAEQERDVEVRAAVDAFVSALADLDLERLADCFAPDASVFFPLRGAAVRADGRRAIEAGFAAKFDEWRAELDGPPYLTIEARDLRVQWVGEAALVTFHVAETGRRTLVLEHRDGAWRVVHLHGSSADR